jgi:hypothetical protein
MTYEKPELLMSGSALTSVQGSGKQGDDADTHLPATTSAYEADE